MLPALGAADGSPHRRRLRVERPRVLERRLGRAFVRAYIHIDRFDPIADTSITVPDPPRDSPQRADIHRLSAAANALRGVRDAVAQAVVERAFCERPGWIERYGPGGRDHCLEDTRRHLDCLAVAVAQNSPTLFNDYVEWAAVVLRHLGIPDEDLRTNLSILREIIEDRLGPELAQAPGAVLQGGLERLASAPPEPDSFLAGEDLPLGDLARSYLGHLARRDRAAAASLIMDAAESGTDVRDLYLHVFQPVQYEVGRLWQLGKMSVAEEHYCTAATQLVMARLYPYVFSSEPKGPRLIAACVGGDLHEVGLRMVADFFEMEGWDTAFVGASTPLPSLVRLVESDAPAVLALSATMTFHLESVAEVIAAVRGRSPDVGILVGGYPFRLEPDLWRRLGADGTATDARKAIARARDLIEGGGRAG